MSDRLESAVSERKTTSASGAKPQTDADDDGLLGAIHRADGSTLFRVWAPQSRAIAVHLVGPGAEWPMHRVNGAYYEVVIPDAGPGSEYFYRLENGALRPDPASRFQPAGVHGPSAVTSRKYPWTDGAWRGRPWEEYVIYEAHVGTFTASGTFEAMIAQLDELADLGVTALELMPVAQFPGARNWGYDGVHPYAPQNTYGGPAALKALVDACHARSLAVVMDVVYNHLGPEGNYLSEFGPYFSELHQTSWGPAINFDGAENRGVREFFIGNALYWISEFHIDALRLDATHAIVDESEVTFLAELSQRVRACGQRLGRRVLTIAESNANDPRITAAVETGGQGIDAQLVDDFERAVHAVLTPERQAFYTDFGRLADIAKACQSAFVLTGQTSVYRGRRWGGDAADLPADRFVCFIQNHDAVGNRPDGKRLGRLVDFDELKLAAALAILSPSIPFLFMGEEYDEPAPFYFFTSYLDPHLAAAVRAGRTSELAARGWQAAPPDPQSPETFACCRLDHSCATGGHHRILQTFYRELLRLRRTWPVIRQRERQAASVEVLDEARALVAHRQRDGVDIRVCFHFGRSDRRTLPLPSGKNWRLLLDSAEARWQAPHRQANPAQLLSGEITLSARSCALLVNQV